MACAQTADSSDRAGSNQRSLEQLDFIVRHVHKKMFGRDTVLSLREGAEIIDRIDAVVRPNGRIVEKPRFEVPPGSRPVVGRKAAAERPPRARPAMVVDDQPGPAPEPDVDAQPAPEEAPEEKEEEEVYRNPPQVPGALNPRKKGYMEGVSKAKRARTCGFCGARKEDGHCSKDVCPVRMAMGIQLDQRNFARELSRINAVPFDQNTIVTQGVQPLADLAAVARLVGIHTNGISHLQLAGRVVLDLLGEDSAPRPLSQVEAEVGFALVARVYAKDAPQKPLSVGDGARAKRLFLLKPSAVRVWSQDGKNKTHVVFVEESAADQVYMG